MAELTFSQGGKVRALLDGAGVIDVLAERIPAELRQAFVDAANKAEGKLDEFLDQERDKLLQKLPEDARFLVTKLKDFDQQSFDLVGLTKDKTSGKAKLGARAGAAILLDRLETDQLQGDVGFTVDDDDALLKLEVSGSLSGSAELKGTTGVLSAGLNFAAGTEQALAYYFAADRSAYVAAVLPRLKDLVFDPSSLPELVAAMEEEGLLRVERTGESTANLGLTIGISQQISSVIGGLPAIGGVGASLSVEYSDAATFSLSVDRAGTDRYIIDFRKTRRKAHSSVLKLGVDVRIVGFRNKVIDQIARAIPEDTKVKELLQELDTLTQRLSEDVLRKELEKVLKAKWPKGEAAIGFLVGEETASDLAEEIRSELQQKIEDVINAKVDLLNTGADAAARTVATEIGDALGLAGTHRTALEEYVGEAVLKAVQAFGGKVDGAVSTLIGKVDLENLLRPWEFVGAAVSDAVKALSKNAQDVVARAREGLAKVHERYTRFRQGVLAAVKEKMEEELSISFISEKERTLTHTRTVRYEFRRADAGATRLYKALWTGDLRDLQGLVAALDATNTVSLAGEYVLVEANLRRRTLAVNFFGLKLGSVDLFSSTVEVGVDLNGRLIVAKSKAELEERRRLGGESQVINATWQVDYLRNAVLDAPLLIKVVLTDKKFESGDEVEEFFGPLEHIEAMRSGISADVETTLFSSTVKSVRDAVLTINVMLRWREWLDLVGSDTEGQVTPGAWQPAAVCRELLRDAEMLAPPYTRAARELMERRPDFDDLLAFLLDFGSIRSEKKARQFVGAPPKGLDHSFGTGHRLATAVADLHDGLVALQANWKTLASKLQTLQPLDDSKLEMLRLEIQAVNTAFENAFGRVLSTGLIADDPGRLHWLTAGTLNLFRSRSDLPNPFLSCTFESEKTGRLLFS